MDPTRNISFAQWAQQIYGPPLVPTINARNVVEHLVQAKQLRDSYTSCLNSPPTQPDVAESFYGTSTTLDNESQFAASTHKTTAESLATTDPTPPWFAANNKSVPLHHATEEQAKENLPKPQPGPPLAAMNKWMYDRLSRIEQLELLVRLKIKTYREYIGVPYIFQNIQFWNIDWEERERRRHFFKKKGEEAFIARYINSNYTGRVEFLYVDPEEVY